MFFDTWCLTSIQSTDQLAFPDYQSSLSVSFSVLISVKEPSETNMERRHPILLEDTSSQRSTHGPREENETVVTELTLPNEEVTQIENILDLWSGNLKVFIAYGIIKIIYKCQ